ncbi:MAG: sterol desaturase family protein [Myxococcales bacterium]|nr:sterol desaturase family protein [Myxococcales bacterium]MDD9964868.1 sterol desaturase family protein [Myxococcales bacterium]
MFDSPLVDRFSRVHWLAVPLLYVPGIVAVLGYSAAATGVTWSATLGLVAAGVLAWTFVEYWLHRTLFHWQPAGALGERMHFVLHGVHHKWPRDRYRLVMPPAVSLMLYWLFLSLWTALMGDAAYAFHAGFVAGYVFYDLMHYYMHHGHPSWGWVKRLRKHHLVHHSPNLANERKFGVSCTMWDHVFGTY